MNSIEQNELCSVTCSVEQSARALIEAHHHFIGRGHHFEFEYQEQVLIVRGHVPSFYLKQVLQCALKGVQGVNLIDNQVTVISSDWRS